MNTVLWRPAGKWCGAIRERGICRVSWVQQLYTGVFHPIDGAASHWVRGREEHIYVVRVVLIGSGHRKLHSATNYL